MIPLLSRIFFSTRIVWNFTLLGIIAVIPTTILSSLINGTKTIIFSFFGYTGTKLDSTIILILILFVFLLGLIYLPSLITKVILKLRPNIGVIPGLILESFLNICNIISAISASFMFYTIFFKQADGQNITFKSENILVTENPSNWEKMEWLNNLRNTVSKICQQKLGIL